MGKQNKNLLHCMNTIRIFEEYIMFLLQSTNQPKQLKYGIHTQYILSFCNIM